MQVGHHHRALTADWAGETGDGLTNEWQTGETGETGDRLTDKWMGLVMSRESTMLGTLGMSVIIIIMIRPPKVGREVEGDPFNMLKALVCHHHYH